MTATESKPTSGVRASGKPARVALYSRVSTLNNQDPEMQRRELREYAERRDWEVLGEYVDRGISGAKDSRPELNRLMADAHRRRFDAVVVWKFDRFARSVSHLLRRASVQSPAGSNCGRGLTKTRNKSRNRLGTEYRGTG